jgi:N-acylneuraminate cytidylyltransferase
MWEVIMADSTYVVGHSKFVPYKAVGQKTWLSGDGFKFESKIEIPKVADKGLSEKYPIKAILFDFDGVISTGDVWTDQNGIESVRCSRRDSLGLAMLRDKFPDLILGVITSEQNPVVKVRCAKLKIPVYITDHTAKSKFDILQKQIEQIVGAPVIYIGDDLNDLECMARMDVISVCPKDAHPKVKQEADVILKHKGGKGAIRELCELFMEGYFDKYCYKFKN